MCALSQIGLGCKRGEDMSPFSLTLEEMTYIYETLHERSTSNIDSRKEKKVCKKVMGLIEDEIFILKEDSESGKDDE